MPVFEKMLKNVEFQATFSHTKHVKNRLHAASECFNKYLPFFQKIMRRNMHKGALVRGGVVHVVVERGVGKEPEGCVVVKTEGKFEAEAADQR